MSVTVKRVAETESLELSEGPHWDADTQSLYSVNIYEKTIHRYVPATKQFTSAVISEFLVAKIIRYLYLYKKIQCHV